MKDVNHALDRLREISGLARLEFGPNGHVELVFDETISVYVVKIDDATMEFVSYLDLPTYDGGDTSLKALLRANHLGDAVGTARLALDPTDDQPLLCRRIEVAIFDDRAIEAALLDFLKHVAFWKTPAADALLGSASSAPQGSSLGDSAFILRA